MNPINGLCVFALIVACLAESPIVAWSHERLGEGWETGTEITDHIDAKGFSGLLKELVRRSVWRLANPQERKRASLRY